MNKKEFQINQSVVVKPNSSDEFHEFIGRVVDFYDGTVIVEDQEENQYEVYAFQVSAALDS